MGRSIKAVSMNGASVFTAKMPLWPSGVEPRLAGIVDNRVHAADRIDLLCDAVDLSRAAQVG